MRGEGGGVKGLLQKGVDGTREGGGPCLISHVGAEEGEGGAEGVSSLVTLSGEVIFPQLV